ncbi:MAG: hypothetical protein U0223_21160 [Nitrospira sp.]|nr:hypothetical protein [Nitrospira sp.]
MAYSVLLAPPAERKLKALAGADALYRVRKGNRRIIYTIQDKELIVLVVKDRRSERSVPLTLLREYTFFEHSIHEYRWA